MTSREPTYCTVEDVAETLDLPDPTNPNGMYTFSDQSHPSYDRVCKLILAAEDEIDMRTKRSWRENRVENYVTTQLTYWHDINAWRADHYLEGGDYIQLRPYVRQWDPTPIEEGGHGDKLELRLRNNVWVDMSELPLGRTIPGILPPQNVDPPECQGCTKESCDDCPCKPPERPDFPVGVASSSAWNAWFDYNYGKLYLRTRMLQSRYNAVRITYRYGEEGPPPAAINRLCCLIVASKILTMSAFHIKVGLGSDIAGIKDQMLREWDAEIGRIFSSFQRIGSVHSMLR